jgi:hypothetical protein
MNWGRVIAGLLALFNRLAAFFEGRRNEELGRLKERERNAEADRIVSDVIKRSRPDSVPDAEAFGEDRRDSDVLSPGKG